MKITKWVDMGAEVTVEVSAEDIREALAEAFAATNQDLEESVNVHDVIRAFQSIGSFLNGIHDDQIAILKETQRKIIGEFLAKASVRFRDKEFYFKFPNSSDLCGPYPTLEALQADSAWKDQRWKPVWRHKGIPCGEFTEVERAWDQVPRA